MVQCRDASPRCISRRCVAVRFERTDHLADLPTDVPYSLSFLIERFISHHLGSPLSGTRPSHFGDIKYLPDYLRAALFRLTRRTSAAAASSRGEPREHSYCVRFDPVSPPTRETWPVHGTAGAKFRKIYSRGRGGGRLARVPQPR